MIVEYTAMDGDAVVARIAELERDLFSSGAWSREAVRQELSAPARTYLLAVDDADHTTIIGYAGFWYDGDDAELMTIGVDPSRQRQGVATQLLDALIGKAREQGAAARIPADGTAQTLLSTGRRRRLYDGARPCPSNDRIPECGRRAAA